MKYQPLVLFAAFLIVLTACSSDDDGSNETPQDSLVLTGFKNTVSNTSQGDTYETVRHGLIVDNRYTNLVYEIYQNEDLTQTSQGDDFVYDNQGRVSKTYQYGSMGTRHYYYDSQGRLVGLQWDFYSGEENSSTQYFYYRFVHPSDTTVFFEKVSLPYDDPAAEIIFRYIAVFDENDNIIQAGRDSDFDGQMNSTNTYTYQNNNLVGIQLHNGETASLTPSDKRNTETFVLEQSFGKRTHRIICTEMMARGLITSILKSKISENLTSDELAGADYEFAPNGFYTKKISVEYDQTRTQEFFFE